MLLDLQVRTLCCLSLASLLHAGGLPSSATLHAVHVPIQTMPCADQCAGCS